MKFVAESTEPEPVVTWMRPVVAPVGTDVRIDVADSTVNGAATPLNDTPVTPVKFVPVTVTEVPRPPVVGVNEAIVGSRPNVAVTEVSAVTTRVHAAVPEQPPPAHPVNTEPAAAAADNVSDEPWVTVVEQVTPQLMPAGADDTVPAPAPAFTAETV